jgi:hypothetical protein
MIKVCMVGHVTRVQETNNVYRILVSHAHLTQSLEGRMYKMMVSFGVGCDENLPLLLSKNELTSQVQICCFHKIKI